MDQSKISLSEALKVLRLRLKREDGAAEREIDREQLKNLLGVDDEALNGLLKATAQTDRFGFDRAARLSAGLAAATAFALFTLFAGGIRVNRSAPTEVVAIHEVQGPEVRVITLGSRVAPPAPPVPPSAYEAEAAAEVARVEADIARAEAESQKAVAESLAAVAEAQASIAPDAEARVIKSTISRTTPISVRIL